MAVLVVTWGCQGGWDEERAEALWVEHCVRCHGPDGRGQPQLLVLSPRINLFESQMVLRGPLAGRSIRSAIDEGYGSMPGFGHKLESHEIDLLTGWVAGLSKRQASPSPAK